MASRKDLAAQAAINKAIRDAAIKHTIDLHKYANSVVRDVLAVLNEADKALADRLVAGLLRLTETSSTFNVRRLDEMLTGVRDLIAQTYAQAQSSLGAELKDFTAYELAYQQRTMDAHTPSNVSVSMPSAEQVVSAASDAPFKGRLMTEWFGGLQDTAAQRVRDITSQGLTQGKTVQEMVQEVRGTKAQNFQDGALAIDKRSAEAVVRTAVSHYASEARDSFFAANSDIIETQQWLSTLDNRTTPECMARDGKLYTLEGDPVGHDLEWMGGPGQIHWNCRSMAIPIVSIPGLDLPKSERASMNGPVDGSTTYSGWLSTQPEKIQNDVLGTKRAAMYRSGELSFKAFFNDKGTFLTLEQLKARGS